MANVNIKFNGKDFLLSCDDGQEEHLENLANHLGNKFDKLSKEYAKCAAELIKEKTSEKTELIKEKTSEKYEEGKKKLNKLNLKEKLIKFKNSKTHKEFTEK